MRRILAAVLLVSSAASAEEGRALSGTRLDHGYGGFTLQRGVASGEGAGASGGMASFRVHGVPALAIDLGLGWYQGRDSEGRARGEVPLTLSGLFYPSPRGAAQLYLPLGFVHDWARVSQPGAEPARLRHAGAFVGLGVELYFFRDLSIFADLKGFVRHRTAGPGPEFVAADGRSTDTSGGLLATVGVAWYPMAGGPRW